MGKRSETINEVLAFLCTQLYEQGKGNDILAVIEAAVPKSFPGALTLKRENSQLHYFPLNSHCFAEDNLKKLKNNIAKRLKLSSGFCLVFFIRKCRLFLSPWQAQKLDLGKEKKMFYFYLKKKKKE